jgi:hypothetical protein
MDGYINWHLKQQKTRAYKDLPETVGRQRNHLGPAIPQHPVTV